MTSEPPDLWPELVAPAEISTPVSILRKQAAVLSAKTRYDLQGDVRTDASGDIFVHRFNIVVPALGNYSYELLTVRHDMQLYPATCYAENEGERVASEKELVDWLRGVFASERTKNVLTTLMAQVSSQ